MELPVVRELIKFFFAFLFPLSSHRSFACDSVRAAPQSNDLQHNLGIASRSSNCVPTSDRSQESPTRSLRI